MGREGGHQQLTLRRGVALMVGALVGHKDTAQLLAELGADVNATDPDGYTGA